MHTGNATELINHRRSLSLWMTFMKTAAQMAGPGPAHTPYYLYPASPLQCTGFAHMLLVLPPGHITVALLHDTRDFQFHHV